MGYRITRSPAITISANRALILKGSTEIASRMSGNIPFESNGSVADGVDVGTM